jgi:glycerophosphoryl diester phosphodiesterase
MNIERGLALSDGPVLVGYSDLSLPLGVDELSRPPASNLSTDADLSARLVAHRGWPDQFPENSLPGLQAAMDAGARWIEFDVQLTSDLVPVLVHDPDLRRISGRDFTVLKRPWDVLRTISVGISHHFGDRFEDLCLATLDQAVELLKQYPDVHAMVEIKEESILAHGEAPVLAVLKDHLVQVAGQVTLISYHPDILAAARKQHDLAIGLVVKRYNRTHHGISQTLNPDFLICNRRKLPKQGPWWPGDWRWVAYVANSVAQARSLVNQGADLVETNCIGDLLAAKEP